MQWRHTSTAANPNLPCPLGSPKVITSHCQPHMDLPLIALPLRYTCTGTYVLTHQLLLPPKANTPGAAAPPPLPRFPQWPLLIMPLTAPTLQS